MKAVLYSSLIVVIVTVIILMILFRGCKCHDREKEYYHPTETATDMIRSRYDIAKERIECKEANSDVLYHPHYDASTEMNCYNNDLPTMTMKSRYYQPLQGSLGDGIGYGFPLYTNAI
jgi:hypothetical protein